jgi:hypothetical protein
MNILIAPMWWAIFLENDKALHIKREIAVKFAGSNCYHGGLCGIALILFLCPAPEYHDPLVIFAVDPVQLS